MDHQTKLSLYYFLHVFGVIFLTAFTFWSFSNPDPKQRRLGLILTGLMGLVVLVSGFGLLAVLKLGFPFWVIIKIVCWAGLTALCGLAYRMREKTSVLAWTAGLLATVALAMVYIVRFHV